MILRPSWFTQWVPGQPQLHSETLSQTKPNQIWVHISNWKKAAWKGYIVHDSNYSQYGNDRDKYGKEISGCLGVKRKKQMLRQHMGIFKDSKTNHSHSIKQVCATVYLLRPINENKHKMYESKDKYKLHIWGDMSTQSEYTSLLWCRCVIEEVV